MPPDECAPSVIESPTAAMAILPGVGGPPCSPHTKPSATALAAAANIATPRRVERKPAILYYSFNTAGVLFCKVWALDTLVGNKQGGLSSSLVAKKY